MSDSSHAGSPPGAVILGMHRSGTSLLARLLEESGLYAGTGAEMVPPRPCNQDGFGERLDVVALNEWLLEVASLPSRPWPEWTGWLRGHAVEPAALTPAARIHFAGVASAIMERLAGPRRPWLVKDPRLCLTLPVWRETLGRPVCVIMHRDPVQVAFSVRTRDRLPLAYALAQWELHNLLALHASAGLPTHRVHCARLLDHPRETLGDLIRFLRAHGFDGLRDLEERDISAILNPGLVHHREDVSTHPELLPRSQQEFYRQLCEGSAPASLTLSRASSFAIEDFNRQFEALIAIQERSDTLRGDLAHADLSRSFDEDEFLRLESRLDAYEMKTGSLADACRLTAKVVASLGARILGRPAPGSRRGLDAPVGLARSRALPAGRPARVVALIGAWNEERFIIPCLEHVIAHGLEAVLIDNASTDRTVELAERFLGKGLLAVETLPRGDVFAWQDMLAAKVALQDRFDADWFMHMDPDEFRLPPPRFGTLQAWITHVDGEGFNAVNFHELTFLPCREAPDHDHPRFQDTLRWYYPFRTDAVRRLNAWKRQRGPVDLVTHGGHEVVFAGLRRHPVSGFMRHYLFLSAAHGAEKYLSRKYRQEEVDKGWHGWRHAFPAGGLRLPSVADMKFHASDATLDPSNPRQEHYPFSPGSS